MARKFEGDTLVIASHNPGKVHEIGVLLAPFGLVVKSAAEFQLEEPEETATDFLGNAAIKSDAVALATGLPALADDSGLVVDALDGAPGIYSARWAGPEKDFTVAMTKIREELSARGVEPEGQAAHFVCALSLTWPDGQRQQCEGKVHGTLTFPPRGEKGFGYDPIFVPKGHEITFAEMNPTDKHAMSHRADAFRQLVSACFQQS